MDFSADNTKSRDGVFQSPRFQRGAHFGLGSILAASLFIIALLIVLGSLVKYSQPIDYTHTSSISKNNKIDISIKHK